MSKLSSTMTIAGIPYGPITDTQLAGESWDDFALRHAVHVLRWKTNNFPETPYDEWTTTEIDP